MTKKVSKSTAKPALDPLKDGEIRVVAMTKLLLNRGRLKVTPGQVVIFGPEDRAQDVHVEDLIKNSSVVVYESEEQAAAIAKWWNEGGKEDRETLRFGGR